MWSLTDGNLSYLCLGATSHWFQIHKILKRDFLQPVIMGAQSNINLSSCLYWYATLNSCKYLKIKTHLRNAQVNKASSVKKAVAKICLVVDMVRKNWSWIVVAGCELYYFVSACFGLFWVFGNFSPADRFKYLFFTVIKIHIMACIVKKQKNFIFSSLLT